MSTTSNKDQTGDSPSSTEPEQANTPTPDAISEFVPIGSYKGVELKYGTPDGYLYFEFEGDRKVKYFFEAQNIIDEPKWEPCDLKGFYIDHMLDSYIGLAMATRRNIKTGRPDWQYKGQYDLKYKSSSSWNDNTKVYPVTEHNKQVYKDWKEQWQLANQAKREANDIAQRLSGVGGKP